MHFQIVYFTLIDYDDEVHFLPVDCYYSRLLLGALLIKTLSMFSFEEIDDRRKRNDNIVIEKHSEVRKEKVQITSVF